MQAMVNIALRAAQKAGAKILRASEDLNRINVEQKAVNDYVSDADRVAEQEIVYSILKAFPEHHVLTEESGLHKGPMAPDGADYVWIVDPLDGTTNFVRGIPHYAVSIACSYKGRIEHAVVYDPVRDESFTASRGRGAMLNNKRLRVSTRKSLEGALLGTGIPFLARHEQHLDVYTESLKELASQSAGIRRAGSAALDLAYVAAGRLDAFWEYGLQSWDIAAGTLLITEAGGLVSDFSGGNKFLESGNIVAGGPKCFKEVLQVVNQHMGSI
ncbi:MAG: inositol monophosphatase family protein [Pseudomonadales bacterium]